MQKSIFSFFNKKDTKSSGESCSDRDLDGISVLEKEKEHNSNETTKDCGIAFVTPKVGDNNPDAGKAIDACLTDSAPKKRRGRAKGKARQTKPKEKESVKITEGTPSELDGMSFPMLQSDRRIH